MKKINTQFDSPRNRASAKARSKKLSANKNSGFNISIVLSSALIFVIIGIVFSIHHQNSLNETNRTYASLSGNLQTYTAKITKLSTDCSQGYAASFDQLQSIESAFSSTINTLKNGEPSSHLPPAKNENLVYLNSIISKWDIEKNNIKTILTSEKVIRLTKELSRGIATAMPEIIFLSDQLVKNITKKRPNPKLIFTASAQLNLAQKIALTNQSLDQQQSNTKSHINDLVNDSLTFRTTLNNMLKGNRKQGVAKVRKQSLRKNIKTIILAFNTVDGLIKRISHNSASLAQARLATEHIYHNSNALLENINTLNTHYLSITPAQKNISRIIYGLEGIAFFILLLLIFTLIKANQNPRPNTGSHKTNKSETDVSTLEAIIKLQNEIAPIASGDLTINATVEKGVTESLSRTVNISIDSLRKLVRNIDIMAAQVLDTANETQVTAIDLASASDMQAQQLDNVTKNINKMVHSFQDVAKQAEASSQLANKAVKMAEQGGQSVRNTLNAMQTLTDDIYHTSSSIKRLGESSQEIGNIVELINDIADQTNILALNASIKASVAGESGQNFTIVADEVQQLAERVTQATKKIESLVTSIQLDTSQAVSSMEQSNTDVMHGCKLALTAGDELLRIEAVSAHLAEFITSVSNATSGLTETSVEISLEMNSIKKLTDHNLTGTKKTTTLTGKLSELANVQQETVKGFKLPDKTPRLV